LTKKVVRVEDV